MPLWTLNTPPIWFPSAVISEAGWMNPLTDEILVAINSLNTRSTGGIFSIFLPLNEGTGPVLDDVSAFTRTCYVTDIAGDELVDDVVWNENPSALNIIQGTQFATCFDIGPVANQLHIVSWSLRNRNFLTDWPNQTLDGGGFYPQNYEWMDPVSGFDLLSTEVVTAGGNAVTSNYTWTDGVDTCTYTFNRSTMNFGAWQFGCHGWDFDAGQFISYTNLERDIPANVTGSLPTRNFNFDDQPCSSQLRRVSVIRFFDGRYVAWHVDGHERESYN